MPRKTIENRRLDMNNLNKNEEFYNGSKQLNRLCAGDSFYIPNIIKGRKTRKELFLNILKEAKFTQMFHFENINKNIDTDENENLIKLEDTNNKEEVVIMKPIPRLVIAQTDFNKKNNIEISPIYRMPGCNEKNIPTTKWSPTVLKIKNEIENHINQKFNHCVITLYKTIDDSLGYHKDKVLDLKDDSHVISFSLGYERPIVFKSNKNNHTQIVLLKEGSIFAIGPKTNRQYKHSIPKLNQIKNNDSFCDVRISLSFRTIDTFKQEKLNINNNDNKISIIGKGNKYQTVNWPFNINYCNENNIYQNENIQSQINYYKSNTKQYIDNLIQKCQKCINEITNKNKYQHITDDIHQEMKHTYDEESQESDVDIDNDILMNYV